MPTLEEALVELRGVPLNVDVKSRAPVVVIGPTVAMLMSA